jgi:hypothetical protein
LERIKIKNLDNWFIIRVLTDLTIFQKFSNLKKLSNLMLALLFFAACGSPKTETPAEAETPTEVQVPVTASDLYVRSLTDKIDLNATTLYRRKANIRATATGYLHGFTARLGDRIGKDVLFCSITTKEQTALKDLANEPGFEALREPMRVQTGEGGIITTVNVQEGDYVSEGDVLASISQPASLALSLNVPYEYQRFINIGKICTVTLPDGKKHQGKVTSAMPTVDAASQTQVFFVEIPNIGSLPENLNVAVSIATGQRMNVLCAPMSAVQTDEMQREFWVMKLIGDSIAIKVPVTAGLRADSVQEVHSPMLSAHDRVVSEGAFGLADTVNVEVLGKE